MTLSKRKALTLILFVGLLIVLPLILFVALRRQEIRPRALQGNANLILNADTKSVNIGDSINVLISLELTSPQVSLSGADLTILYDKSKLSVKTVDVVTGPNEIFTDAPIIKHSDPFDNTFDKVRIAVVSNKSFADLPKGTITIGTINLQAIGSGAAVVKFPENNSLLQVVGQ